MSRLTLYVSGKLLTADEACEFLNVSKWQLGQLRREGRIHPNGIKQLSARKFMYYQGALEKYLESHSYSGHRPQRSTRRALQEVNK